MEERIEFLKTSSMGKSEIMLGGMQLIIFGKPASVEMTRLIFALAVSTEKSINETCDLLNQLLQSFSDVTNGIRKLADKMAEMFGELKETCESRESGRIQHGSSKAEKPRQEKASNKWSERYRPP